MPYISQDRRDKWDHAIDSLYYYSGGMQEIDAGDLNYVITALLIKWLLANAPSPGYDRYNTAIGVLESAKLELYRRRVAPYEDVKIRENGDI